MRNTELLQSICNKLNELGFTEFHKVYRKEAPFDLRSLTIRKLDWLPKENLSLILSADYSSCKSFAEVYYLWNNEGYLDFKPYIYMESEDDNPSLVLSFNKFLHMFRGYYFQISGTSYGSISHSVSVNYIDSLYSIRYDIDKWEHSELYFMLLYSNMIDVGFQNKKFIDLFNEDRELVDDFFRKSMIYWHRNFDYGYDTIEKYMYHHKGTLLEEECPRQIYEIKFHDECVCRFKMTANEISVEYCSNPEVPYSSEVVTLTVPDPIVGITKRDGSPLDDEEAEDLRNEFKDLIPENDGEKFERMLTMMLLKLVGISTNFTITYPIRKVGNISPSNGDSRIVEFKTCRDFYNKI